MENTLVKSKAQALKCFGRKTEYLASDPDVRANEELTQEYNCSNCEHSKLCDKLFKLVWK